MSSKCTTDEYLSLRRWRFDWALVDVKCAIEINGGAFTRGRHTRGQGYIKDMEKLNAAQAQGWKVYCFSPDQIRNGEAMTFLKKVLR